MNIAEQMWESERANDLAIASTARLLATALDARIQLRAGARIGHEAVEALTLTINQQTASRRSLLEAHDVLNDIKGIAVSADEDFGGLGDKEVKKILGADVTPLRRAS